MLGVDVPRGMQVLSEPDGPVAKQVKDIYYHLYSNSNLPRAERLANEFVKILFCKFYDELEEGKPLQLNKPGLKAGRFHVAFEAAKEAMPGVFESDEKLALNDVGLDYVASVLSTIQIQGAREDVLGQAFQTFLGPSIRGEKGQFFTPKTASDLAVRLIPPEKDHVVLDPACGTGTFLASAAANANKRGLEIHCLGGDRESDLVKLARLHMAFLGTTDSNTFCHDSLDKRHWSAEFAKLVANGVDRIYTNPPFGSRIKVADPAVLSQYELGHKWKNAENGWERNGQLLDGQDPQVLFLELCVQLLSPGGKCAIVLPEGLLTSRSNSHIHQFLTSRVRMLGIIDCPRELFQPSTDVKSVILLFEKSQKAPKDVFLSFIKSCGHDRRGRPILNRAGQLLDEFVQVPSFAQAKPQASRLGFFAPWEGALESLLPRFLWHDHDANTESLKVDEPKGVTWRTLGELEAEGHIAFSRGVEPGAREYASEGIRFIRTSDIYNFEIAHQPTRHVSSEFYRSTKDRLKLAEGDILFVADGRYRIGNACILTKYDTEIVVQSHIKIIRTLRDDLVTPWLLFSLLASDGVQHQIAKLVGVTTTIGSIGRRISEIRVPIPTKPEERAKASSAVRALVEKRAAALQELSTLNGIAS